MLGLNNAQFTKYEAKLIKKTKHTPQQVNTFFCVLNNRMDSLYIASLEDLLIRYESIDRCRSSERDDLLKEIVGVFHLNNLKAFLDIFETEKHSLKMIKMLDEKLQSEKTIQIGLDVSSEKYRDSIKREKVLLERKQYNIDRLID